MQRQGELLQPRAHDLQEASGLGLVLESDDEIVGIAAFSFRNSRSSRSENRDGKQTEKDRLLRCSIGTSADLPSFNLRTQKQEKRREPMLVTRTLGALGFVGAMHMGRPRP